MKKLFVLLLALTLAVVPALTMLTSCIQLNSSKNDRDDDEEEEELEGYEKAVKNYEDVMNGELTEDELKALVPEDQWEDMEDEVDDFIDYFNEMMEVSYGMMSKDLEIGDVKYKFKVVDANKITDEVDIEELEDSYDVKIEEAYEIEVEQTVKVNTKNVDDEDEVEIIEEFVEEYNDEYDKVEYTAAKIDGKWYLIGADIF